MMKQTKKQTKKRIIATSSKNLELDLADSSRDFSHRERRSECVQSDAFVALKEIKKEIVNTKKAVEGLRETIEKIFTAKKLR